MFKVEIDEKNLFFFSSLYLNLIFVCRLRLPAARVSMDEGRTVPDGVFFGARLQDPVGAPAGLGRLPVRRPQRRRVHFQRSDQSLGCLSVSHSLSY